MPSPGLPPQMRCAVLGVVGAAFLLVSPTGAQQADSSAVRARIQVVGTDAPVVVDIERTTRDTLFARSSDGRYAIARSAVLRLDVWRGTRDAESVRARGIRQVVVAGAVITALLGFGASRCVEREYAPCPSLRSVFTAGLVGTIIGAMASSGEATAQDLWQRVPPERWVHPSAHETNGTADPRQ